MNARETAEDYIGRGWSPIPIPHGSKGPSLKGWPKLRINAETVSDFFRIDPCNIGVLLGEPSGGLVDVDLDAPEAEEFADLVLISTAVFGRNSKPKSHWLYRCPLAAGVTFKDPVAKEHGHKEMLCEIRTTGDQTVFPGSIHPTGEEILWYVDQATTIIEPEDLLQRVKYLAGLCLLSRYWPAKGGRHDAAVPLTGVLTTAGMPVEMVARVVTAINSGESFQKHLNLAIEAKARLENGRPLQGIPTLRRVLGETVTATVLQWLGIAPVRPTAAEVSSAVSALTPRSSSDDIEAVLALLRSAKLSGVESEGILKDIKRCTGCPLGVLKKQYGILSHHHQNHDSTQAQQLVEIGKQTELWYDDENRAGFASITRDGHTEHYPIASRSFGEWLSGSLYAKTGVVPDSAAIANARTILCGLALHEGQQHHTWLRVAQFEDCIYVDLCDATWSVVRISAAGWGIVTNPPVRFRRTNGQPLPVPERGGTIQDLRPFVNADDEGFMLVVGILLNAFRPDKPFPILHLAGEKGTAKSTCLRHLRRLIDPSPAGGAGLPLTEGDLFVVARNSWLVSGDNVSWIRHGLADALCRLSTGGGLRKRKLWTDGDDFAIDVQRPVFLTGLSAVSDREDFLDRVVMVTLDRIEGNRKTEEVIDAEFASVCGRILGALFDGVATALRRLPHTVVQELPRMADFVLFATAASEAYGWEEHDFLGAYMTMREAVFEDAALGNPVVEAIADWFNSQQAAYPGFDGSATDLLKSLKDYCESDHSRDHLVRSPQWPGSPSVLSRKLREARSGLLQLGVDATVGRDNDNKSRVLLKYRGPRKEIPPLDDMPF